MICFSRYDEDTKLNIMGTPVTAKLAVAWICYTAMFNLFGLYVGVLFLVGFLDYLFDDIGYTCLLCAAEFLLRLVLNSCSSGTPARLELLLVWNTLLPPQADKLRYSAE